MVRYWHPDIEKREARDLQTGYLGNPGLTEEEPKMPKAAGKSKSKPMTKSDLLTAISADTDLTRREVSEVLDSLSAQISRSLGRGRPGMFTLPGLVKIEKKRVPARKARKGVPNPFRPGELMDIAAKPATTKIKVRALKNLKDMV